MKQIKKEYEQLLIDVATKDYYTKINLDNRVNCYVCENNDCKHITKTIDIDAGVTPMFFECEKCGGRNTSTHYRDIVPMQRPTIEWYRPRLNKLLKMKNKALVEHILRGGLNFRKKPFTYE